MSPAFHYFRKEDGAIERFDALGELLGDWRGEDERWLFMAPHDDDVAIGAGLTMMAALGSGVEVHAVITTDGSMGYCSEEQRYSISRVRQKETMRCYGLLGLPGDNVHFLRFPDCNLSPYVGRRRTSHTDATAIKDYTGLQNSYTHTLRRIRPTRVLMPTGADLHPDHKIAHQEMLISLFHASGEIWPELGPPIDEVPRVYEFAVYCDFVEPPQLKVESNDAGLTAKLKAIEAYESQRQISGLVDELRQGGPIEFIREVEFQLYSPRHYRERFKP